MIITNPPFSLWKEFTAKCIRISDASFILLRLSCLGSKKNRDFWLHHPPKILMPISPRPSFTGKGTDNSEYAFFGWGEVFAFLDVGNHEHTWLFPIYKK